MNESKVLRLLEALDCAICYIENIAGSDCQESETYQHLIKELRECGENANPKDGALVQILKDIDKSYLYFDLRTLRNTDADAFRKLATEFAAVNKHFKG